MENDGFNEVVLQTLKERLTKILPNQIRACLDELSEDQIWWRPNESSNSIGNLILHVSGSLKHYLAHQIGGIEYSRNRSAEFAERSNLPKAELLNIFNQMITEVSQTIDSFAASRFLEESSEPHYNPTLFHAFLNATIHLAVHTGQIVFIAKMLKEGAVEEIWIKSFRN
ncbi:MAG: DUF1572 family protein [Acidobacteriota bacterium]